MFTAPDFSFKGKIAWAAIAIVIYGLGMSYFGAWGLMIYNITPNTDERNNLITITKFFELFGTWIPSLVPVLVTLLPKISSNISMQDVYSGFARFMLILSAFFAIFGCFNMRERVPLMSREEMKETSVLESLKNIITNRPLIAVILANFFNSFKSVGGSSESYFWLNNTGSLMNATICGLFTGIPNYIMVPMGRTCNINHCRSVRLLCIYDIVFYRLSPIWTNLQRPQNIKSYLGYLWPYNLRTSKQNP